MNIIRGIFEVHITVKCETPNEMNKFITLCETNKFKPLIIMLPSGVNNRQVMTSSFMTGCYPNIKSIVFDMSRIFESNDFIIDRIKIEAMAHSDGVPTTISEKILFPDAYFEFHHKISISSDDQYSKLIILAEQLDAKISSSVLKESIDKKYIVTKRVYDDGRLQSFYKLMTR